MSGQAGHVFNIERHALHDGPGIRTLIFLSGCPLSCKWCSNPEGLRPKSLFFWEKRCTLCGACARACPKGAISLRNGSCNTDRALCDVCSKCVSACPNGARELSGKEMTADEILDIAVRDAAFYTRSGGGITLSGGEPFFQPDFVYALLREAKSAGLDTAVETSGAAPWHNLERCVGLVDHFLFDIKHIDPVIHCRFTGLDNVRILDNLRKIAAAGAEITVRVPIIPTFNDTEEQAGQIADTAARIPGIKRIDILPFHKLAESKHGALGSQYAMSAYAPLENARIEALVAAFRQRFPETYLEV